MVWASSSTFISSVSSTTIGSYVSAIALTVTSALARNPSSVLAMSSGTVFSVLALAVFLALALIASSNVVSPSFRNKVHLQRPSMLLSVLSSLYANATGQPQINAWWGISCPSCFCAEHIDISWLPSGTITHHNEQFGVKLPLLLLNNLHFSSISVSHCLSSVAKRIRLLA